LLEEIDERLVAPVFYRERAERLGMFPAQNADHEDPGFLRLPSEIFGWSCAWERKQQQQQEPTDALSSVHFRAT
jgi:hypothetical protein